MYLFRIFFSSFLILLIASCKDERLIESVDCENFTNAAINYNSDLLEIEVNKLTGDLKPQITENYSFGHKDNLDKLMERLNSACDNIEVQLGCYACIYTLPPQSELIVTLDSADTKIKRVIDISTPKDDILKYVRIHEYFDQ